MQYLFYRVNIRYNRKEEQEIYLSVKAAIKINRLC
jgi:hypothetical protein